MRIVITFILLVGVRLYAVDTGLPNLSDRPQEQDKSIDVFAGALYWRASQTVDWAHVLKSTPNKVEDSYKTIAFNWDPGFRVGVGYNMIHDQWDTQLTYTKFQTEGADDSRGPITSGFLAARLSLLEPFHQGKIRFDLHYNMFDWDLGRSFLVSRSLSLRPFMGIKAGWIDQKLHASWTTPNFSGLGFLYSAKESVKNNFQGAGPRGGVNGKWIVGSVNRHVFSFIGNFAGAFMWGHWTLQDNFTDIFLTKTSVPMKNRNFGAVVLQALLGAEWAFNFDNNRSHFSLRASYEIQDWLNHFQVFTNDSGTDNLDLYFQGLTLDLHSDF